MTRPRTLQKLRTQIDAVDAKIVALFDKRAELAREIGAVKRTQKERIFDPAREDAVFANIRKQSNGSFPKEALELIYKEILCICRSVQKKWKMAYLGPAGSNSHLAAIGYLNQALGSSHHILLLPYKDIPEVFEAVVQGKADAALVPLENSIEGAVRATQIALFQTKLKILGEYLHPVKHILCIPQKKGREERKSRLPSIQRIYSHPQAFAQCRKWLKKHYPKAKLIETSSTSAGALMAGQVSNSAAITTSLAAKLYKLTPIHENIADRTFNITRFITVSNLFD